MPRAHPGFLLAIMFLVGCTTGAGLLTSTANPVTGDFTPCTGYGVPPPGEEGRPGPWANRLMIAYSDDGLTWTRALSPALGPSAQGRRVRPK